MHLFRGRDVCIWFVGMLSYMCNWVVGIWVFGTWLVGMLLRMCIWVFGIWWVGGWGRGAKWSFVATNQQDSLVMRAPLVLSRRSYH